MGLEQLSDGLQGLRVARTCAIVRRQRANDLVAKVANVILCCHLGAWQLHRVVPFQRALLEDEVHRLGLDREATIVVAVEDRR